MKTIKGLRLAMLCVSLLAVSGAAQAGLFGASDDEFGLTNKCLEKNSRALCLMKASKFGKDMSDVSLKSALAKLEEAGKTRDDLVIDMIGIGATLDARTAPGMSRGGEIGMILLQRLLQTRPVPLTRNMVMGWMPLELAATPDEARMLMHRELLKATFGALPGHTFEPMTRKSPLIKDTSYTLGTETERFGFRMTGGDCDEQSCTVLQWVGSNLIGYVAGDSPKEGTAPEWMGGYKAWVFTGSSITEVPDVVKSGLMVSHKLAGAISKSLPKWVYVTTAPAFKSPLRGDINEGQGMPIVYNEGKPMGMIFPELDLEQELAKRKQAEASK